MAKKKEDEMKPKAKYFVGIKGDPKSFVESRGLTKFYSGVDRNPPEVEEETSPAMVVNRLDHNMTLTYEGAAMVIPPRGKVRIANSQKLGGLPKGMQLIPLKAN